MYASENLKIIDNETFALRFLADRPMKLLQLTDLHLGFGFLSKKQDELALNAVRTLVKRSSPDLIVVTGDQIFPFILRSGTLNNERQAKKFIAFMDSLKIPYTMVFGNHDCELGSKLDRQGLSDIFASGKYSIFSKGAKDIFGVGNFIIELTDTNDKPLFVLVMLDSNMYENGWFFSGFDLIHEDQTAWCMKRLNAIKQENQNITALAFFHMPPREMKEAYEKMKLGDPSVTYKLGSIGEKNDYFGISYKHGDFFEKAAENRIIKAMFFGHDHLNTLSLVYKGIQLTYGMSIDYLGYAGITKKHTQRGGTLITLNSDGSFKVDMLPLTRVVSEFVRGETVKRRLPRTSQ